jgi:23S rRNA pseudouridine2604 synthase
MKKQESRLEQEFREQRKEDEIRLNKYISESGRCSRREADRLIEAGAVLVDGKKAEPGWKVLKGQEVLVQGKPLKREETMVLLAVNKPRGVVCTTDKRWNDVTVEEILHYPRRIFYMGRLDKDSEGLLLMTNNGEILNKMMRAGNYHEKEYLVTVNKPITDEFIHGMANGGIPVLDQKTRPCKVIRESDQKFRIILTQGLNRQIRRMCEYFHYEVTSLKRLRVMNISLGNLKPGEYREVTREEQEELYQRIRKSSNKPQKEQNRKQLDA